MFEGEVSHVVCLWVCRPVNNHQTPGGTPSRSRLDLNGLLSVCCCVY